MKSQIRPVLRQITAYTVTQFFVGIFDVNVGQNGVRMRE